MRARQMSGKPYFIGWGKKGYKRIKKPTTISHDPITGMKLKKIYQVPRWCWYCGIRPITDDLHECSSCGGLVDVPSHWIGKHNMTKAQFYQRFQ